MTATPIIARHGESIKGERETREDRAVALFHDGAFERISKDPEVWVVESPKRKTEHAVCLTNGTCDCQDFDWHRHLEGFACYHLASVTLYSRWLRDSARKMAYLFREAG